MDLQTLLAKNKAHRERVAAQQKPQEKENVKEAKKELPEIKEEPVKEEPIMEEVEEELPVEQVVEAEEELKEDENKDLFSFDAPAVSKKKGKRPAHREYMVMEDIDQVNDDAE